jgi:hypothetical protein
MAKLKVTALVQYAFDIPYLLVSVENADGEPVIGLTQKNFTVGTHASLNHIFWNKNKISNVTDSGLGFYIIEHALINPVQPWGISSEWVFTVSVDTGTDHGQAQAWAPYECCHETRGKESKEKTEFL